MAAAAKHLASVTLELGGKSPVVVDASADVVAAAERLTWAKFVNAGQTCVAPDYVLVHESLASIIDDRSLARLQAAVDATLAEGARLVTGGLSDPETRRLAPTVLADVANDATIMKDEIFGPVLPLVTFRTLDEAIAIVRTRPKPLALYLFAHDEAVLERLLAWTTAGGTSINIAMLRPANPQLPFGGTGESGQGKYHGWFGFEALSTARAVYRQHLPTSTKVFYPPYGTRTRRALKSKEVRHDRSSNAERPCRRIDSINRSSAGIRKAPVPHEGSSRRRPTRSRSAVYPARSRINSTTCGFVRTVPWTSPEERVP